MFVNKITWFVLLAISIFLLISFSVCLICFLVKRKQYKKTISTLKIKNNELIKQNLEIASASEKNFVEINSEENLSKNQELLNLIEENKSLSLKYSNSIKSYEEAKIELDLLKEKEIVKLVNISQMNIDEAKRELLKSLDYSLKKQKAYLIKEFNQSIANEINEKSQQLIIDSFQNINEDFISSKTSFSIKLEDDQIKGKIIGKDGRNKKYFEKVTGADLIIEKEPEITVSCYHPIRREIAKNVLEKLLINKNIEPNRIEKYYEQEKEIIESKMLEIGRDTLENKLNIFDIDEGIYPYIGRLYFRTSYGQNVLSHSIECAYIAMNIARMLNLDVEKAKRAAFFHDIGKSLDFEIDNDHVESGIKLAKTFKFDEYLINAIESHHEKVPCNNFYSSIVKIADKISASKPGARSVSFEEYIKRVTTIEAICNSVEGVKSSYAIKAGKQVRIIIDPKKIDDSDIEILGYEIKRKLEDDIEINKQPIELIIIRENRLELKTDGNAVRFNEKNQNIE